MKRPVPISVKLKQAERDLHTVRIAMKELRRMCLVKHAEVMRYQKAIAARNESKAIFAEKKHKAALPKFCEAEALGSKCGAPADYVGKGTGYGFCTAHAQLNEKYGEQVVPASEWGKKVAAEPEPEEE